MSTTRSYKFGQIRPSVELHWEWKEATTVLWHLQIKGICRDVYSKRRIIAVIRLKFVEQKWHDYKHLDWITVRRDDDALYKFKEGDLHRLRIQDIEDMLLLLVQGKVTNLSVEERIAFNVSLRMFTRRVVIQRRVEDLQLGVDKTRKIRLHGIDELHKFSDGTLDDVRTVLNDRLKGIRMEYLPETFWSQRDKAKTRPLLNIQSEFIQMKMEILLELNIKQAHGRERDQREESNPNHWFTLIVLSAFESFPLMSNMLINQSERGISINQEKYVKDLLKKYDINGSSLKTPMVPPNKLGPDLNGKAVNETWYRANPKESYLNDVKRIFRYLKGTPSLGLWYPKCAGFDLKGYSDSDYVGCNMDRKSTSGAYQLLGGKLMCWSAKSNNL
ncbi:hypothetical protein Tco_0789119 [Tanacetum coccineum]